MYLALVDFNVVVALMLYAFRDGDANMRSVWFVAAMMQLTNIASDYRCGGVFGTGTMFPDLIVALSLYI